MCKSNTIKRTIRVMVVGLTVTLINPCFSFSQNLVANYSFELQDSCPNNLGQLSFASYWFNPQTDSLTTPDFYSSCDVFKVNTPNNLLGYAIPLTDSSYIGLVCYQSISGLSNLREYAESKLDAVLVSGEQYYLEINVTCAENVGYAQNFIGMAFSDTLYVNPTYQYFPLPTALEYIGIPIIDTANWTKISGIYTATGNEQYLILGSFKPDNSLVLDSSNVGSPIEDYSYYYFDDIKVIPVDSLQGIDEPISNFSVNVYPNPAKEWLTLDFNSNIQKQLSVSLFSMDGKEIKNWSEKYTSKMYLTLPQLSNGIYFLKIRNGAGEVVRKVIVGN